MTSTTSFTELGSKPIGSLLLKYATPAVIAMTASSLYNIIDAIFIGQGVGPLAIAGISLTFPVMQLTAAFGAMVGVGASTLLSVKLGEKDYDSARKILGNVLVMNIIMGIVIGVLMEIFINPILYFFGASTDTVTYARDFMRIILAGNVITHLYMGLNALLRSSSHPREAMMATIYTVLINLVLAPTFIYYCHWGIKGAAWATVISQTAVLLWQFKLFSNKHEFLHFQKGTYRLNRHIVTSSLAIGLSPFLINLCGCLITVVFNWSLTRYGGDLEIASYGIVNRLGFLFFMIIVGLNQGMQPIAGYNFGARNFDRLNKVLIQTILVATVVCVAGFILGVFFPAASARLFTTDEELIRRAGHDMPIYFITYPIIGFQVVTTSFFQCIGVVKKSIFLSLSRQLIFLLPLLIILPQAGFGVDGVWYSIPCADVLATFTTAYMLYDLIKKFKRKDKIAIHG
jgi:putative MATE family efflux protein